MPAPSSKKPTALRVLDAAEDLFAERGYAATSLGDGADRVGVRQPSLYNHFKSKQHLYECVLERLLDPFLEMMEAVVLDVGKHERSEKLIAEIMNHAVQQPNVARLIQHAVLTGDTQMDLIVERWLEPVVERGQVLLEAVPEVDGAEEAAEFSARVVMAFNSLMLGYVTLAPLHKRLLGIEPLEPQSTQRHIDLLVRFWAALWNHSPESSQGTEIHLSF